MLGSRYFSENGSYRSDAIEQCFSHIKKISCRGVNYILPSYVDRAVVSERSQHTFSEKRMLEYSEAPLLFLPLCYGKPEHWYLFWVEKDNLLRCLDGKNAQCLGEWELSRISERIVTWLNVLGKDVRYGDENSHTPILEQILEQAAGSQECGLVVCYYAWRLAEGYSLGRIRKEAEEKEGYRFFQQTVESILQPPEDKTEKLKILAEINQSDESDESDGDVEIIGTPPASFLPSKSHNKRIFFSDNGERQASKRARVEETTHPVSPRKIKVF